MRAAPFGTAALAGAGAIWSAPALAPFVPPAAAALGIRTRLASARGIALTFDDGPHSDGTPAVLEQLDRAGAIATFFLVGEQVQRNPTLAAEIVAAGHEIALHGYLHRLLLARRPRALSRDLDRATAVIEDATGRSPVCYRPPYGVFSIGALDLVRRRGLEPILWSRWGCDWRARETPEGIARRVTRRLQAGDVVLLHDADHYSSRGSWRKTVAALPAIVESAAALAEPFVPLTQST
jgi:peptidoglycan/xylan/chitin deacetylase (PgdA/CDA1 family)